MLGVLRAALLSSVAFVRQSYAQMVNALQPLAYWHLGEAGGLLIVDERAVQNGTYKGTTQGTVEYGLAPLVEGSTGSSIAFDGIHTYGEIPHNGAFQLASYTIDFAFQADTAPALGQNQVLFSKDVATLAPAGALSIEILNSSGQPRLRAYAGGAAGNPIWIGGPGGAADLQVGRAYKVAVTLDPTPGEGARLYLDGEEVAHAPSATVGWTSNNTEPFVIGAYSTAALAKFDGVIDEVALFPLALPASTLRRLAQATTIARQTGTSGPVIPRTDFFLTNDDQNPATLGSTLRFAAPGASGNGLSPATPGNLHTLLAAASAGHVIVCAQGYYDAPNGLTIPAGASASNPVTVVAAPGEWAVICQDIDLTKIPGLDAGTGRPAEVAWTLWDAAHNIWRIPYTANSGAEVVGCWFEGGIAHMLWNYASVAAMQASQGGDKGGDTRDSNNTPQTRSVYWSAGLAVGDANGNAGSTHLYIRFDRPNWTDVGFVHGSFGAWPDDDRWVLGVEGQTTPRKWFSRSSAGDFKTGRPVLPNPLNETPDSNGDLPSGRNPNNARIYAARRLDRKLINPSSGGFIRIGSGINSHGFRMIADAKSNIEFHRGCDWLFQNCLVTNSGNVSNVTFHRRRMFSGEHRLLTSMGSIHFSNFLGPANQTWEAGFVPWFMIASSGRTFSNITFDNCLIAGFQEVMVDAGVWSQVRFVNSCIAFGYDEFAQIHPQNLRQFELGWCYFRDQAFGISTNQDTSGTANPYGKVFLHHNIVDARMGRASFAGTRPINGGPVAVSRNNSTDTSMKHYNNTWIHAPDDPAARGLGLGNQINHEKTGAGATSRLLYDEAFNNILVRHDVKRYATNEGANTARSDDVEQALVTTGTNNAYRDYNCYSRHGLPIAPGQSGYERGKYYNFNFHVGGPFNSYAYIRAVPSGEPSGTVFFGSSDYNSTKTMQSLAHPQGRGFDDNSTDENPGIPSQTNFPAQRLDYRPRNLSVVTAPATPPSEANWWSAPGWTSYGATPVPFNLAPSPWKGALDPNGLSMPVGVQNP